MISSENYYYGQGKLYLSPFGDVNYRFIGDVSELNVNLETEKKQKKASIGGRIVIVQEHITEVNADLSMVWHNFSLDNLAILLGAATHETRQSWTEEKFTDIKAGDIISLEHTHVRSVKSEGLVENVDFNVDATRGTITFLTTPAVQPFIIDYDFAAETSIALLSGQPREWSLRYHGVNLAENGQEVIIEFYRLSLGLPETIELITNGNNLAGLPITAQLLADLSKGLSDGFGLFARIVSAQEFKTIVHNGEIDYDGSHDFAY